MCALWNVFLLSDGGVEVKVAEKGERDTEKEEERVQGASVVV